VNDDEDVVDGISCDKCGAYSYCMCKCKYFKKRPVPQMKDRRVFFKMEDGDKYTCCNLYCERLNLKELIIKDFKIGCQSPQTTFWAWR